MTVDDRIRASYALLVGLFMGGLWGVLFVTGGIPELRTAPLEIGYHLLAELLTAAALVTAGGGLLRRRAWARRLLPVALGMLLYTVLNSAGYYAQLGDAAMLGTFTVLTVVTLALLGDYVAARPDAERDPSDHRDRSRPEELDA